MPRARAGMILDRALDGQVSGPSRTAVRRTPADGRKCAVPHAKRAARALQLRRPVRRAILERLFDVRPGDGRLVATSALALFTLSAAHAVLETARDAMFVAALPPAALPIAYASIALLSLVAVWRGRGRGRRDDTRSIGGFLVAAAGLTAALPLFPDHA